MTRRPVVLASSSRYRATLLRRLLEEFEQLAPDIDESAHADEPATAQVERLSRGKARAIASQRPGAIVIASDQLAVTADGQVLGKPGSAERATAQLRALSSSEVVFHTGVCVLDAEADLELYRRVDTVVRMRELTQSEIESYVAREQPYDCAGSFKAEALGIALFEWVRCDDPTALVGLPLIATVAMLREAGYEVLAPSA